MRASGYMVQWEQEAKRGWEKTRAYYQSRGEADTGARQLESTRGKVRKLEVHPLYKR